MKPLSITSIILLLSQVIWAQQDGVNKIKYTPQYKFKDGIYLNFKAVKNNNPTPKERIVTSIDPKDFEFFEKVLENKTISTYDALGELIEVKVKNIWGFSHNGVLYINANNEFNRIPILGSICHFVANKTTIHETSVSPSGAYNNYSYYNNSYNSPTTRYATKEMTQYILDFETGKIMEYNAKSVSVALMKDPELHDEFEELSSRKQEKKKFYYIRQFNKRNPLYLPLN